MNDILEDILLPKLKVVFCGTAASNKSAELKSYYAGQKGEESLSKLENLEELMSTAERFEQTRPRLL